MQQSLIEKFKSFKAGEEITVKVDEFLSIHSMIRVNIGLAQYTTLQNGDFMTLKLVPGFCRCSEK